MAKVIYKYPFKVAARVTLRMPAGATILRVECQGNTPCAWAIVDADNGTEERRFRVFGTGQPLPAGFGADGFLATFQQEPFVWHMFEDRSPPEVPHAEAP